jgi:3D (Asp-Asp-Asp) domain-containing protein
MIDAKKIFPKTAWLPAKVFIVSLICVMVTAVLTGLTTVSNTVTIHEDGYAYSRYTIYTDLKDILEQEGIALSKDDKCEFTGFEDHEGDIYITRAFEVSVSADGQTQKVVMTDGTVADALKQADVALSDDDLINVSLEEPVSKGTRIQVNRVTFEESQETQEIPFETVNPDIEPTPNGRVVTLVEGENGEKLITKQTKLVDGEAVETTVISEEVTKEPVNKQLGVMETVYIGGQKMEFLAGEAPVELDANGIPVNYAYKVTGKATAYSALGRPTKLTPGAVAMDLSRFPRGTKLYIVSSDGSYVYGYSTVRDTGTAVNNGSVLVDCFFNTYGESVRFGAKTVDVYVLN